MRFAKVWGEGSSSTESELLLQQFRELFRALHQSVPPESCVVTTQAEVDERRSDSIVIIKPRNPNAAKIDARLFLNYGVYLSFGHGGVFEVPLRGKRYTELDYWDEIRALCSAVMAGQYREAVSNSGGELTGASAEVVIAGGKPIRDSWVKLSWALLKKKQTTHHIYEPYS